MNTLRTSRFRAERQSNGDVWIASSVFNAQVIVIPQSKCKELADLLWPNVESDEEEWVPNYNQPHKVDYTHCEGEPE